MVLGARRGGYAVLAHLALVGMRAEDQRAAAGAGAPAKLADGEDGQPLQRRLPGQGLVAALDGHHVEAAALGAVGLP